MDGTARSQTAYNANITLVSFPKAKVEFQNFGHSPLLSHDKQASTINTYYTSC